MKKIIICTVAALLTLIGSVATFKSAQNYSQNPYLDTMVEALAYKEFRVGTGTICAYAEDCWCIYHDPYEEYEASPVSDIWIGPWK